MSGAKSTQLGLFNFRAVLNVGMLLTGSEKAKQVRARILDIVISIINKRAGGGTKYINTRDINVPDSISDKWLNFDEILEALNNQEVLKRLKQA